MSHATTSAPVRIVGRRQESSPPPPPVEFDNNIYRHEARAVLQRVFLYLRIVTRYMTLKKLVNFLRVELDYRLARPVCKGRPWSAKIEPTNVCNLQCTYCPREDTPYGQGMMSLAQFEQLVGQIKEHTLIVALHLWGEPLLHKGLADMIRHARRSGIGTYVSSNFNRLTEEQARALVAAKLDLLTVCVDGSEQETYEVFRKGGKLSKVLQNVETFMRVRREMGATSPHVEMQFLVTPKTEHEIGRMRGLAASLGVDSFKAKPVYPIMVESKGEFVMPDGEHFYPIKRRAKRKTCWWLWRTVTIGWEGSVLPCCRVMFESSVGNVFESSLEEVWNNPQYRALRNTFVKGAEGASPCNVCHVPYSSIHG